MTMKFPFILPCPICGETPTTYEWQPGDTCKTICSNCGFNFDYDFNDEPADAWNNSINEWYKKNIPPKKCPSCGNTGEEDDYLTVLKGPCGYFVCCASCQHVGLSEKTIPAALVAWNKQPEPKSVTTQDKDQ
ncbi:hypothetical protein [Desulfovibrio sp. An276]|uniref:hypothetical protein n=1 Tax=Desulfovibrio sp. An276 TaxID=1965618 RepID=UPI00118643E9|nr:hypothetical protein [Desulfovibrio sp. An276]